MKFDDVINDIEKMVGLELESIRKGANLKLDRVNKTTKQVELTTSLGKPKTRSFSELKKIWDELCLSPTAHVDSVLGGSNSSRNQPETIIANLPYIEYLYLENKKHLTLIKEKTHDYGTLLKMDDIRAVEIKDKIKNIDKVICEILVITNDIRSAAVNYEEITGLSLKPISPGLYEQYNDKVKFTIISNGSIADPIDVGTYVIIKGKSIPSSGRPITIDGKEYFLLDNNGLMFLVLV